MQNNNSFHLSNLVLGLFNKRVNFLMSRGVQTKLPSKIGKYNFVSKYRTFHPGSMMSVGLYSLNKEKMVAKIWNGKFIDYDYTYLKNEIESYNLLKGVSINSKKVLFPKPIYSNISKTNLVLGTKFVDGKNATKLTLSNKYELLIEIISFLERVGKNMSQEQKSILATRSFNSLLAIFPLTVILSLICNSKYSSAVFKGLVFVILNITQIKQPQLVLAHRDLDFDNIFLKNNKIYLMDLESLAFAPKYLDIVTTLKYQDKASGFRELFIKKYKFASKNDFKQFQIMGILESIHGLATRSLPKLKLSGYADFINYLINLEYETK